MNNNKKLRACPYSMEYVTNADNSYSPKCKVISSVNANKLPTKSPPSHLSSRRCPTYRINTPEREKDPQWYCCRRCFHDMSECPSYADPATGNADMPFVLSALPTTAAKRAVSLCSIYSSTFRHRNPYRHQWRHIRGGVLVSHKSDRHYYGMFGYFTTQTPTDYDLTYTQRTIKNSLRWLRANNPLYKGFFSNYETLYRWHISPFEAFHNANKPKTSNYQPVQTELLDEKDGLILPIDDLAKVPPIHTHRDEIAAVHPDASVQNALDELRRSTRIKYNDPDLEAKAWPTLFPYGCGSWNERSDIQLAEYQKSRLLDIDPRFRNDPFWSFFNFDRRMKRTIAGYNRTVTFDPKNTTTKTAGDVRDTLKRKHDSLTNKPQIGQYVPRSVPASKSYWKARLLDVLAMSRELGKPSFFITLTMNDDWPELRSYIDKAPDNPLAHDRTDSPVDYTVACIIAYMRRWELYKKHVIDNKKGPFGKVTATWWRHEFQKRGAIHTHIALWCDPKTIPNDCIRAELPRGKHSDPELDDFLQFVRAKSMDQLHAYCRSDRCFKGPKGKALKTCKYGFPFDLNDVKQLDKNNVRYLYRRTTDEDCYIVEHNMCAKLLFDSHVCDKEVIGTGWEMYLAKYLVKAEPSFRMHVDNWNAKSEYEKYQTARIIGRFEADTVLLGFNLSRGSHAVEYLPTDLNHRRFVLKPKHKLPTDDESTDIHFSDKWDKYLDRPSALHALTYYQLFKHYRYTTTPTRAPNRVATTTIDGKEFPMHIKHLDKGTWIARSRPAILRWTFVAPTDPDSTEKFYMQKFMLNARLTRNDAIFSDDNNTQTYMHECRLRGLITSPDDIKSVIKNAFVKDIDLDRIRDWITYFHEQDWLDSDFANDYLTDLESQHKLLHDTFYHEVDTNEADESDDESAQLGDLRPHPKPDLNTMIASLTPSQKQTFDYCIEKLHCGTQLLTTILGCAGTGKSHVLRTLVTYMRDVLQLNVAITAPTGVAAWLVDGKTIHHTFGLDHELETRVDGSSVHEQQLRNVDVLIIDECSMMTNKLFLKVHNMCWTIAHNKNRTKRFGGKHVVMFGDIAQLPPVGTTFFVTPLWRNHFKTLLLKDIVRQNDPHFINVLGNLRIGKVSNDILTTLQSRKANLNDIDPLTTTVVVSRRKSRDELNEIFVKQISSHDNPIHTYHAIDTDAQKGPLSPQYEKYTQTKKFKKLALPKTLTLCKHARVMVLRNSHVKQGWVNGTMCEVELCTDDIIFVRNLHTGERKPIFRETQRVPFPGANFHLCRQQFPIMLAFAVTVHKIQGSTLPRIAILCSDKYFASGQMYVAVSRVRNLDDLFLLDFDPNTFPSKVKLSEFFEQLLAWVNDHDKLNPDATHTLHFPTCDPKNTIDPHHPENTIHNADDVLDPCDVGDDTDSDTSETHVSEIDVTHTNPDATQIYNALVVELATAFHDNDSNRQHSNIEHDHTMHANDTHNIITTSNEDEPIDIETMDEQYEHQATMLHNLTITSSATDNLANAMSYKETIAT